MVFSVLNWIWVVFDDCRHIRAHAHWCTRDIISFLRVRQSRARRHSNWIDFELFENWSKWIFGTWCDRQRQFSMCHLMSSLFLFSHSFFNFDLMAKQRKLVNLRFFIKCRKRTSRDMIYNKYFEAIFSHSVPVPVLTIIRNNNSGNTNEFTFHSETGGIAIAFDRLRFLLLFQAFVRHRIHFGRTRIPFFVQFNGNNKVHSTVNGEKCQISGKAVSGQSGNGKKFFRWISKWQMVIEWQKMNIVATPKR